MTSHILNRFNIDTDKLLWSLATKDYPVIIHPQKMIKIVRSASHDHIIIINEACYVKNLLETHNKKSNKL